MGRWIKNFTMVIQPRIRFRRFSHRFWLVPEWPVRSPDRRSKPNALKFRIAVIVGLRGVECGLGAIERGFGRGLRRLVGFHIKAEQKVPALMNRFGT